MNEAVEIVRHPRARRARLSVDPVSGRARLTLPPRAPLKAALRWAEEQRGWIEAQRSKLPQARPFAPGAILPFGDEQLTVDWRPDAPRRVRREEARLCCGGPEAAVGRQVTNWLKRQALALLSDETAFYADRAGVSVPKVSVGDPRGRWGSCSASGAIRYSWRLILAPAHVRRATVAHEVAHRIHMNHRPAFHALVAELFGSDPAPARRWLRANGAQLHWLGRDS